jgi:hypothetical protein
MPVAVLTLAAGLVLADGPLVTLALPDLVRDLHTSVQGVAAVLAVYTAVLAAVLIPAGRTVRGRTLPAAGAAGFALMAVASVLCATSSSLAMLLTGRAIQAAGGAVGLAAGFTLLDGGGRGRGRWIGAAVLGAAAGPVLGGVLTQVFDWHAIFVAQVPVALAGAAACLALEPRAEESPVPSGSGERAVERLRPSLALALVSGALLSVLFLLVLLLIAGWAVSPLGAAALVSVLPLAALVGARLRGGDARARAVTGCLLIGGGVLALAWLPGARLAWTIPPQVLAGLGMGLALPALGGRLLPERTAGEATRTLAIRHAGMALVLVALAPIAAHQLGAQTESARERGIALVLDAKLSPQAKLQLAPALLSGVEARSPRAGLRAALASNRSSFSGAQQGAYEQLARRADDTLVAAVATAFRVVFIAGGALAFLAALLLVDVRRRRSAALLAAATLAVAVPVGYAVADSRLGPAPVQIGDPCKSRALPSTGGLTGFIQDRALELLDTTACRLHATREELVLALASTSDARRFARRHGADPRSMGDLLSALLGLR